MVKRFQTIEEIIGTDGQGEKVQKQDLASLVWVKVRDYLPRVLTAYLIIFSEKPSDTKYPKVVKEYKWQPIDMRRLKEIRKQYILWLALTIC